MASGKKGRKTKGKTFALTDFLQETTGTLPTQQPIRKSTSWVDELEEDVVDTKTINVVLPTAPKASRDYDDISSTVPKEPPYMAYLSNLPYDVDEDEIGLIFKNLKIVNMRIPKDDRPTNSDGPKLKGFGYVQFEDRESLLNALIIPDTTVKNRRIRIEVAANQENDRRRMGGGGGRMGGDRHMLGGGSSTDTSGDWRTTNRPDPVAGDERRGGGGITRSYNRDYNNYSNRDRDRDFSRNSSRDSLDDRSGSWRSSSVRDSDRSNKDYDRDKGYSRNNYRERDDDRGSGRRGSFRRNDENGVISRNLNQNEPRESDHSTEPRQRPKLNLAPRTKPLNNQSNDAQNTDSSATKSVAQSSTSIFGNAKPVDTTERERQIEEKLLKQKQDKLKETIADKDQQNEKENVTSISSAKGGAYSDKDNLIEKKNNDKYRPPSLSDTSVVTNKDNHDLKDVPKESEKEQELSTFSQDKSKGPNNDEIRKQSVISRSDKSPENKKRNEKRERVKRDDKREKDKEMPKLQEPKPPNFQGNNKFALLPEDDGF